MEQQGEQLPIKIALAMDEEYMGQKPKLHVKWNVHCWHWFPGFATFHDPLGSPLKGEWMFTWLALHVYSLRALEYLRGVKNVF